MNLLHLKYAVVIAETRSMTKAAEKLYTSQPNLSRAMRELESTLGITVFKRTSQGIITTPDGDEFLGYARKVLAQVDEIEEIYKNGAQKSVKFSISVPRASYISCAFTEFVKEMRNTPCAEFFYKETNASRAVSNILNADYKLGIIRYQDIYEKNFCDMLKEKELKAEVIYEFKYHLIMSSEHPLAGKEQITISDLSPYTEIAHADPFVPSLSLSTVIKNEVDDGVNGHVYVFERGSQMDLLSNAHDTFMWVSPVPDRLLLQYGLVQRHCVDNEKMYRDVLIYKKHYSFSEPDKKFIEELTQVIKTLPR